MTKNVPTPTRCDECSGLGQLWIAESSFGYPIYDPCPKCQGKTFQSARYLQWVIPGEIPDYEPFEVDEAMIERGAMVLEQKLWASASFSHDMARAVLRAALEVDDE